jgi:hypothetical protein
MLVWSHVASEGRTGREEDVASQPGDNKVFGYPPDLLLIGGLSILSSPAPHRRCGFVVVDRLALLKPSALVNARTSIKRVPPTYTSESDFTDR